MACPVLCYFCDPMLCTCLCTEPVYDRDGIGCGPCGGRLPCPDHPGSTRCSHCGYPRDSHGLGRPHVCVNFVHLEDTDDR